MMNSPTSKKKYSKEELILRVKLEKEKRKRGYKRNKFTRLPLYPKQSAIVDDPARFTICEATTKAGKTMSHIEWLLDVAIKAGEGNWWWVATVSATAEMAFRRCIERLRGYIDTGGELKKVAEPIKFRKNETKKYIQVAGATIWFKSAHEPDTLYGEDVRGMVGDEITRWPKDSWTACYTTLTATKGRAKLIGNVKGRHNFAYELARLAEQGREDWGYHKLTALDAVDGGVVDQSIVDQAKRDLSEEDFNQLYLAEAEVDDTNPFDPECIIECLKPLSTKEVVCYGLDIARKRDWLVLIGLDEDANVALHKRWTKFDKWKEKEKEVIASVGYTPVKVDSTGVGDRVVQALRDGHDGEPGCANVYEFPFTEKSRQQILEGLEMAVEGLLIGYPDGIIRQQLDSFEKEHTRTGIKYIIPDKFVDDDVIALALAWDMYKELGFKPKVNLSTTNSFNGNYKRPTIPNFRRSSN